MRSVMILFAVSTFCYGQTPRMNVIDQTAPGGLASATLASRIVDANSDLVYAGNVTRAIAGGGTDSSPNAIGHFTGGTIATGQLLPAANRDAQQPNALGFPHDADFKIEYESFPDHELHPNSGDANVLSFSVTLNKPGYLRFRFIFATDEWDAWTLESVNDTAMAFVDGKNILRFKETVNGQPMDRLLDLVGIRECGFLRENDVAPAPDDPNGHNLDGSAHHNDSLTHFDHEYGGFTKILTKESELLNVGTHNIKLVIHDVRDNQVDSAIFIPDGSFKLFAFRKGDYNVNGVVDAVDYVIWRDHQGMTNAKVTDGDGDGNGIVNFADYSV